MKPLVLRWKVKARKPDTAYIGLPGERYLELPASETKVLQVRDEDGTWRDIDLSAIPTDG